MLAILLLSSQIEAASRFWEEGGWETKEFAQLKKVFPNIHDAVKLKAVVLNALYGTNVFAIDKVGDHLENTIVAPHSSGPELVEELVSEIKQITKRNHYSFVAKYAHFFIGSEFPILDWYAEYMVGKHLGPAQSKNPKRYLKFVEDVQKLKELAGLTCDCAQLDAYLWVAGEYWYWKEHPTVEINADLKAQFERLERNPEDEQTLAALLGIALSTLSGA
jgi:hypothetical protein